MTSRKILSISISAFAVFALLASCGEGEGQSMYTIVFETNGGSAVSSIEVPSGQSAAKPADPTKSGYAFEAWCKESALVSPFDWSTPITADWTLYAKWVSGGVSGSSSSGGSSASLESSISTSSSGATGVYYFDAGATTWWSDGNAITNAHYWTTSGTGGTAWPGIAMSEVTTLTYKIEGVPSDVLGFVFNRQNPDATAQAAADKGVWNQSVDALVEASKNCFALTGEFNAVNHLQGNWTTYSA